MIGTYEQSVFGLLKDSHPVTFGSGWIDRRAGHVQVPTLIAAGAIAIAVRWLMRCAAPPYKGRSWSWYKE